MAIGIPSRSGMAEANPIRRGPSKTARPRPKVPSERLAKSTVLVIDDEDIVRAVATQMLRILGCRVLSAANAREGLAILRLEERIDAILLDNHMPEMNGSEAFTVIRKLAPEIPVLFISGLSLDELKNNIVVDEKTFMMNKPYRFIRLQETLELALCSDEDI